MTQRHGAARRVALVYRGPASSPGCPESVAALLASSGQGFEVNYVGPREPTQPTRSVLHEVSLYAQPGGGELGRAYRRLRPWAAAIRDYVTSGGRYLGFCLGGYLAGATPRFRLLPGEGDTDQYIRSACATVTTASDTLVTVVWRGQQRQMYFQDGPLFELLPNAPGVVVLARYTNGAVAAAVARCGEGKVGVVGPHPEAQTHCSDA